MGATAMRIAWAVVFIIGVLVILSITGLLAFGAGLEFLLALFITVYALGGTGMVRG